MERAGLDMAWVPEAYGFDAATQLGYLAATTRLHLGAGVFNIYSRTPTVLAQTAATLDSLSDGRAALGIGTSGPQVVEGWNGVAFSGQLARTREVIDICRRVWRGEVLDHEGTNFEIPRRVDGQPTTKALRLHAEIPRATIPIYVAAMGPKNVELTAAVADGWLPMFFVPEKAHEIWGDALTRGRSRRDPSLGPLQIVAGGTVAIGERIEHLRNRLRPALALLIGGFGTREQNFYNQLVARSGFEAEARKVQELFLGGHRRDAEAAVPEALLEATSLIGSPSYVRDRVEQYHAAGVTMLDVTPMGPEPARTIAALREML
jgi:F420-dependent oxidoreductase-like protein